MKKLHDKVNLIPIIAKADTMITEEIKAFKATVLDVIAEQKIQIYEFPDIDDDDVENNHTNNLLKVRIGLDNFCLINFLFNMFKF